MVNPKHAFWQALVLAVVVFGVGLLLGFFLETSRTASVSDAVFESENALLDQQLRDSITTHLNASCSLSQESLFRFADQVYEDANRLEQYDAASKFTTSSLRTAHKRYDLLRLMLWIEASKLKTRCHADFHTVVYLYDYAPQTLDEEGEQKTFSRLLLDLKNEAPASILLVPIARNMNLEAVSVAEKHYNLPSGSVILIDDKQVISSIPTFALLNESVFGSSP